MFKSRSPNCWAFELTEGQHWKPWWASLKAQTSWEKMQAIYVKCRQFPAVLTILFLAMVCCSKNTHTHTHTHTKQKQKTLIYVAKCLFEKSVGIWLLWLFRTLKEEWKGIGPLPCPRRVSSQALSSQLGALLPQRGLNFFCISRLSLFLSWREGSSFLWFERGYGVAWSLEGTWFCIYWCGNDTDLDPGPPSIEID